MIDANGILNVTATDMRTSQSQSIEVKPSYGLSDTEVERMIEDSFKFAAEDIGARKLIEARLDAEALIKATDKSFAEAGHLVALERSRSIRAAPSQLSTAKDGTDPRAIRSRMAELEQAAKHLNVVMLDDSLKKRACEGKKYQKSRDGKGALMDLKWQDAEEIAIRLVEEHPETDPLTVRFTDMHAWIVALPEFKDDPKKSNEKTLETIQMAWHEEYQDSKT